MNRDEILTMEAGREMDALVSELVMEIPLTQPMGEYFVTHDMAMDAQDMSLEGTSMGVEWGQIQPEPYSTDISAAWDVVKRMQCKGFEVCVNTGTWDHPSQWHVNFSNPERRTHFDVHSDTAPLSICRSALLAVMED
jgi:hypothetical protein